MVVEFQAVHCPSSLSDQTLLSASCLAGSVLSRPSDRQSAGNNKTAKQYQLYINMIIFTPEKKKVEIPP